MSNCDMPCDYDAALEDELNASQGACDDLASENIKLRELVRDMWRNGMCECDDRGCSVCEYGFNDRARELGIEVD